MSRDGKLRFSATQTGQTNAGKQHDCTELSGEPKPPTAPLLTSLIQLGGCGYRRRSPTEEIAPLIVNFLVMLEDDLDRISRFLGILTLHHPAATLDVHRTAHDFIDAYSCLDRVPDLICLDHDLFSDSPDAPDPGDGRDVAAFLVTREPTAPTLIHSTNAAAADSMLYSMRDHGWNVDRIAPLGEDWIESYWYPTAKEMVAAHDGKR